jgi:hypothetical protein
MNLNVAKMMVEPGDVIEFLPQWMFTNVAYADKNQAVRGTVIKKYEHHFLVKLKHVKECFRYTDLMTGHVRVVKNG